MRQLAKEKEAGEKTMDTGTYRNQQGQRKINERNKNYDWRQETIVQQPIRRKLEENMVSLINKVRNCEFCLIFINLRVRQIKSKEIPLIQ